MNLVCGLVSGFSAVNRFPHQRGVPGTRRALDKLRKTSNPEANWYWPSAKRWPGGPESYL